MGHMYVFFFVRAPGENCPQQGGKNGGQQENICLRLLTPAPRNWVHRMNNPFCIRAPPKAQLTDRPALLFSLHGRVPNAARIDITK